MTRRFEDKALVVVSEFWTVDRRVEGHSIEIKF